MKTQARAWTWGLLLDTTTARCYGRFSSEEQMTTQLLTFDSMVEKLRQSIENPHCHPEWLAQELTEEHLGSVKAIVLEMGDKSHRALHIRVPGPHIQHYKVRNDLSIDGTYAFEQIS